jgi:serine/threonine-protein kinase HipA
MAARSHDERTLIVLMNGVRLGEVYQDRARRVRLRYDSEYMHVRDAVPLSLSMPLAAQRHQHAVLAPWLSNLLPDRPEVLTRWRQQFRVADVTPFGLLRHVGEDVAGAAQFVRPERVEEANLPGPVEPLTEEEVAEWLRRLRRDAAAWEPTTGTGQFSLAGAQSKFALHFQDGQWGLATGRTPTTHIVKPAIRDLADQDINEHLSMRAARQLGLAAADSQVVTFEDERAFVTRRYDRRLLDGEWIRIHQEDLCQALGLPPERKYQSRGGPSAADVAELIRSAVSPTRARDDLERFADAIIFNWLIVGTDAHAKNYSLLLAQDQVRLAPLYDLNSYLPYVAKGFEPTLSMFVGASDIGVDHIGVTEWTAFAKDVGLPEDYVLERITVLAQQLPAAFSDAAQDAAVVALDSPLPGLLIDAVAARASRAVAPLRGQSRSSRRSPVR